MSSGEFYRHTLWRIPFVRLPRRLGLLEFPCGADFSGVEHCNHGAGESTDQLKKLLMRKVFSTESQGRRWETISELLLKTPLRAAPSQKYGAKTLLRILCDAMREEDGDFAREAAKSA